MDHRPILVYSRNALHHSTFTWVLEPMLERCGSSIREAHYNDSGTFAEYMCARVTGDPAEG